MAKLSYFPWNAGDYLSDPKVTGKSLEEQGAYVRLLSLMWKRGESKVDPSWCSLPDNDVEHARSLGITPRHWKRLRAALVDGPMAVFTVNDDGLLVNKRLTAEFVRALEKSKKAATAARQKFQQNGELSGAGSKAKRPRANDINEPRNPAENKETPPASAELEQPPSTTECSAGAPATQTQTQKKDSEEEHTQGKVARAREAAGAAAEAPPPPQLEADEVRLAPQLPLPADFGEGPEATEIAVSVGISPEFASATVADFADAMRSRGFTSADWPSELRRWCRRAALGQRPSLEVLARPKGAPAAQLDLRLIPFADEWNVRCGVFPVVKGNECLLPVVGELGADEALRRWRLFLAATDPKHASPARFAETHRRFEHGAANGIDRPRPGGGGGAGGSEPTPAGEAGKPRDRFASMRARPGPPRPRRAAGDS